MAGIGSMTGALDRGDVDEASRQGTLAGPAVVETGLAPTQPRLTQLAAIAASPHVEDRAELLPALATLAQGPDRRTAIPAALAARTIATELSTHELPDDLASDDIQTWRALFESIAANRGHTIEVRVYALDTVASLAATLDPSTLGFELANALEDPDPDFRAAAVALVPAPTPAALQATLAKAILSDADDDVARFAANALCDDKPKAVALLGAQGIDRIKKLAPKSRCLAR
ncbi:MAG TPA: hypothetical protein VL326_07170 [Kofleriaceae bacterium]|nr:hypothetical protein [Kofleriaceae bacterium]